jgi:hypothetical protein
MSVRLSITSRGQNQLRNVVYIEHTSTNGQFPTELRCKLITLKALQRGYIILSSLTAHVPIRIGSRYTYLRARNNAVNIAMPVVDFERDWHAETKGWSDLRVAWLWYDLTMLEELDGVQDFQLEHGCRNTNRANVTQMREHKCQRYCPLLWGL